MIVFITDVAGIQPWPSFVAALGREGRPHPPDARAREGVGPGDPGLRRRARHGPDGGGQRAPTRSRAPRSAAALERVGTPDDVVGAVRYLVEADYVTGVQLIVDGGRLL